MYKFLNEIHSGSGGGTTFTHNSLSGIDGGTYHLSSAQYNILTAYTIIGSNLLKLPNPSAISFPRFNADNTVSSLSEFDFKIAIHFNSAIIGQILYGVR